MIGMIGRGVDVVCGCSGRDGGCGRFNSGREGGGKEELHVFLSNMESERNKIRNKKRRISSLFLKCLAVVGVVGGCGHCGSVVTSCGREG